MKKQLFLLTICATLAVQSIHGMERAKKEAQDKARRRTRQLIVYGDFVRSLPFLGSTNKEERDNVRRKRNAAIAFGNFLASMEEFRKKKQIHQGAFGDHRKHNQ